MSDEAQPRKRGPAKRYPETVLVRLPIGTRDALAGVAVDGETESDVIRAAIEREIERRFKRL